MLPKISKLEKQCNKGMYQKDQMILNNSNLIGWFSIDKESGKILTTYPQNQYHIHICSDHGFHLPYFYLVKNDAKRYSVFRIKLLTNRYFRVNDDCGNKLSEDEAAALFAYMQKIYAEEYQMNYFQNLVCSWNVQNPRHRFMVTAQNCPNYMTIKEPK